MVAGPRTDKPVPGVREVLVQLKAAALNHRDLFVRQYQYAAISLDHSMLSDGYGAVTETRQGDSDTFIPGENVLLTPILYYAGTARGYDGVRKDEVSPTPKHLSATEGAALPLVGLTPWRALVTKAAVQAG
ncbi:zinc-type alcohol dehydrogenase [Fusarium subglutinans]|uniref:Zinc-type alcohol dehydrogenase n=1 Tax=Gibberella subglutinans TaxID=42677 RepID=A0A8H5V0M5_GIBSU|nr:zinc-type alcohol dehydrogenase [Fusarium subglutinans]KAF5606181.1 zinc-type alcohol dehydrogenase [Fusarium subglutinans]